MTLKQETFSGMLWSFTDNLVIRSFQFIVGIILARILSPREFGLVGMLAIFMAVSMAFIESGFSQALIRKKNCTHNDYSTVFYFNLGIAITMSGTLILFAGLISRFFKEPLLKPLLQVLSFSLVLGSFGIIQRVILTRNINFKFQAIISFATSLLSGIIAIAIALCGGGVWSLVILALAKDGLNSLGLWIGSSWRPSLTFSRESFKELFSFGSKILASGLLDKIFSNLYYVVIGRYFSAVDLGYFTRADQFKALPSQNITDVIQRVSFPVLAKIQDDQEKLKGSYRQLIKSTMLITFILMLGLCAMARPIILILIGEKWLPVVPYLQLLCLVGMFYPLHALNLNILQVKGRSDLFLRLEILKKVLVIPVIIIGVKYGISFMIVAMIVHTIIAYYLNSYWSGRFLGYPIIEQIRDIFLGFAVAAVSAGCAYMLGMVLNPSAPGNLGIQGVAWLLVVMIIVEGCKLKEYIYLKNMVLERIRKKT